MEHEPLAGFGHNENKTSLIDCYRLALDFGLPAAQQALKHLSISLPQPEQPEQSANSSYKIPG